MINYLRSQKALLQLIAISVFIALPVLLFFPKAHSQEENEVIDIAILIYSGRPNPSWLVDDKSKIMEIKALINDLPEIAPLKDPAFGAFLILNKSVSDFPRAVIVFDDIVSTRELDGTRKWYRDVDQNLITLLSTQAINNLGPEAKIFIDGFEE